MGDLMIESPKQSAFLTSLQEGNQSWTSEKNVQLWINTLEEREFSSRGGVTTSEASSPTRKSSFDSDVFLQLPGSADSDDLVLGAEAKHYGHLSPRLSPIVSFEKEDEKETDDNFINDTNELCEPSTVVRCLNDEFDGQCLDNLKKFLIQQNRSPSRSDDDVIPYLPPTNEEVEETKDKPTILKRNNSLTSQETYSSFSSSFDRPSSLAAYLRPDPEDLLLSLGFGSQGSVLQSIPERFFLHKSEAYGIDVSEIHNTLLVDDQEEPDALYNPLINNSSSSNAFRRFDENSIDLNSAPSTESSHHHHQQQQQHVQLNAKTRRILFASSRQDIPSIHLTLEEDRSPSPTSVSLTSSGWMRLETLEEVSEPNSRGNSFEYGHHGSPNNSNKLDQLNEIKRRLSDISQGRTLVNEPHLEAELDNHFIDNSLKALPIYKRTFSDKSMSSVVTVINTKGENSMDESTNDQSHTFKPIHSEESPETAQEGSNSPSTTAANKRSMFGSSKKESTAKITDNVFSSGETSIRTEPKLTTEKTSDAGDDAKLMSTIADISDVRRASLNDSFKDFIKTLATETSHNKTLATETSHSKILATETAHSKTLANETSHNKTLANETSHNKTLATETSHIIKTPQQSSTNGVGESVSHNNDDIRINVQAPTPSLQDNVVETIMTDERTHEIPPTQTQNESKSFDNKENERTTQPIKKGYFSSAIDSLSNVFGGKNQQHPRQSTSSEDINFEAIENANRSPESSPSHLSKQQKKPGASSSFFRLFNHQTLPVHSNSAFSSIGLSNGVEVDIDQLSSSSNDSSNQHKQSNHIGSSLSTTRNGVVLSPVSSDGIPCGCPTTSPASAPVKRRNRQHQINKNEIIMAPRRSLESSGVEDEIKEVKCPLGKNCSLAHKNGRHVYPANESSSDDRSSSRRRETRKITNSSIAASLAPSNSSSVFTHEHFDYLVQQVGSVRIELKDEFQKAASREENLKVHFTEQMEEMKKAMTSEYMGWIAKEMQQLKSKLQEKDDEIRRLRDILASVEASKRQRKDSIGTPV